MIDDSRCPECGSWGEECSSETPVNGCGCQRCLRHTLKIQVDELNRRFDLLFSANKRIEQLEAELARLRGLIGELAECPKVCHSCQEKARDAAKGEK